MHSSHRLPPMDALAALLAAADSGSFTGAAETLGVTHGSVSRRIATLEAWIGVPLLRLPLGQQWLTHKRLVTLGTRVGANPSAHYICTRAGETRPAVVAARDRLQSAAFT